MKKPCCDKQDKNKGAWSKQEDLKLVNYIQTHGEGCWRSLPHAAGLHRCGKSCRLRWINYLRPDLKRGNFSEDEDDLIIKLHALLGNRWSLIAGRLPGRTDNEVKNYWNSHLRRKLIRMGIDPNKHRLSHKIPRPQNQQVSASTSSSGSKKQTCKTCQPAKSHDLNDQLSNTSTLMDNDTCVVPDLNLDLTITIASHQSPTCIQEEELVESKSDMELKHEPSPALLLFK